MDMSDKLPLDELKTYLTIGASWETQRQYEKETPYSISSLIMRLLNIQAGDSVLDYGTGSGGKYENISSVGPEGNQILRLLGKEVGNTPVHIRTRVSGANIRFITGDMFTYYQNNTPLSVRMQPIAASPGPCV